MSRSLLSSLTATFFLSAYCFLVVVSIAAPEPTVPMAKTPTTELSKPVVGPVHSARGALGMEIGQADAPVGRIEDFSLDIGQGTVRGVYFRPIKPVDDKQDTMLIPMSQFQWPDGDGSVTMAGLPDKTLAVPKENKNSPSNLIMLTKSASIRVLDGRGKPIGHVVDFGLSRQKGQIAYAVLHLGHSDNEKDEHVGKHEKVYAIPLAAFLVKADNPDWTLDLPEKMLEGIPSFKENESWPRVVAGTWTEYIHVRYGRSVLGGVQSEDKKFDNGGRTNPESEPVRKQF
jgi:sporulation protein YlmC with PRC-barrel domain